MTPFQKKAAWTLLGSLLFAWRFQEARESFREGLEVLPSGSKGLYQVLVLEEPQVLFPREKGHRGTGREGAWYRPEVTEVRTYCLLLSFDGKPLPALKVRCSFRLSRGIPAPVLSYGDSVKFFGKVQVPRRAMNPGQFDYEAYLRHKGVAFTAFLGPGQWTKEETRPGGSALLRACYSLKRAAETALCRHLPYPQNALLDGILLGEKSSIPIEVMEHFFLTGTVHILAVSGLMTAFVSGVLFLLLRSLGLPRKGAAVCSLAGLACFVCMTGADPPVCRAGLFSALALGAVLFERRVRGGTLLLATAVVLAFLDPFVVLDLSFQISFLATTGLMAGAPRLGDKLASLGRPLAGLVATTVCAQLSVWFLLAHLFNQASPYALLANLVVVPLALLATLAGLALLAGSALHPGLGDLLGEVCGGVLAAMTACAGWVASFPGGEGLVASSPALFVLLFHVLLAATFLAFWPESFPENPSVSWMDLRRRKLRVRRWMAWAWSGFALLCAAYGLRLLLAPVPLKATFLAVGHGSAAVLEAPGRRVLVVDAGRGTRGPDRYHPLVSYLRHRGIREVDWVLATHPDSDHVGGLANLAGACRLGTVFFPDTGEAAPFPENLLERLKKEGIQPVPSRKGQWLPLAGGLRGEVLHPDGIFVPGRNPDNNLSLAVKIVFGRTSFLFPGDLEKEGLDRLLLSPASRERVDWLLAPHHGRTSGEPLLSAKAFLPRFTVLSDSRDHPESAEHFRGASPGARVFSTAKEGAIEVEVREDGSGRWRSFREGDWKAIPGTPPTGWGAKVDFIEK